MLIAKSYYGREAHQGIQRLSEGITPYIFQVLVWFETCFLGRIKNKVKGKVMNNKFVSILTYVLSHSLIKPMINCLNK